VFQLINT